MVTIGVAVAVPEPWGSALQRYRVALGDLAAAGIPTHITLLPPVEVEAGLVGVVEDHLRRVAARCPAFRVHLRGTGTFRPVSPVVYVNVLQGASRCGELAAAVRDGPLLVGTEPAYPYHPHVTVAHRLEDALLDRAHADLASFESRFTVDHLSLYRHEADRGWLPDRELVLAGDGGSGCTGRPTWEPRRRADQST